jgi:hypothetical protein
MREIDVEGTTVQCRQLERRRVWSCTCDYFALRKKRAGARGEEGAYCPHVAVAIMRCIQDGTIDVSDEGASEIEAFVEKSRGVLW